MSLPLSQALKQNVNWPSLNWKFNRHMVIIGVIKRQLRTMALLFDIAWRRGINYATRDYKDALTPRLRLVDYITAYLYLLLM